MINKATILDLAWAADDNYVFLAGVSMTSAFENNKDFERIRVWFLAEDLSEENKKLLQECADLYGREIYFFDMKNMLKEFIDLGTFAWGGGNSYSAYSRIFLGNLLQKKDVQRVIYCDCDLIIDGSLRPIIEWNLGEKAIAMVMDYNRVEIRDIIGLSHNDKYFNSGFMLMDVSKWIRHKCSERIFEHMRRVCPVYPYADQDFINCVLSDEIDVLPIQYNVNPRVVDFTYKNMCIAYGMNEENYYSKKDFDNVKNLKIIVYHCSDPTAGRPWEEGNRHIYSLIWNCYFNKSLWREIYKKKKYNPSFYPQAQRILRKILPGNIYALILGYAARNVMLTRKKDNQKYHII